MVYSISAMAVAAVFIVSLMLSVGGAAAQEAPEGANPGDTDSASVPQDASGTSSLPSEFSQCSLCPGDGVITTVLNRTLDLGGTLPANNCVELAALANLVSADTAECTQIKYLGTYCGCPVPEGSCSLCANGESVLYPDKELDWFSGEQGFAFLSADYFPESFRAVTCELLESALHGLDLEKDSRLPVGYDTICFGAQLKSTICGCQPLSSAVVVFWAYRIMAIMSLLGSSLILYDVFSQPKKMSSTYHQMVIGVSCFDLISSTAYALVGVLLPESGGFYRSSGNQSTCKVQGFLIQLGLTSMFYNMLLSLYYLLVVKYNWKEFRFQKYRRYGHALVVVIGSVMALAAFPFYGEETLVCYVVSPPRADSNVPITIFYTIPLSIAVVTITAANVAVCWKVYRQEQKALKWRLRQDQKKNMRMTRKVVRQSLLYAMSFYFTIPLAIITCYIEYRTARHFSIAMGVNALTASQGFLNALVYYFCRYKSLPRPGRLLSSVIQTIRRRLPKGNSKEENQNMPSVAIDEVNTSHVDSTTKRIDQSHMHVVEGGYEDTEGIEDSPNLGDEEHRDEFAAEEAFPRDLTDHGGCSSPVVSEDAVNDESSPFEATVEHWLLTKDDGQLQRPTLRLLKQLSFFGVSNRDITQAERATQVERASTSCIPQHVER